MTQSITSPIVVIGWDSIMEAPFVALMFCFEGVPGVRNVAFCKNSSANSTDEEVVIRTLRT